MAQPIPPQNVQISGRAGVSPIGTSNPNTGSVANTGSSYAPAAFASGVNVQGPSASPGGGTEYTLSSTDYQGLIIFDTADPVSVTLNYGVGENFTTTILNIGNGAITLTPIAPAPDSVSPLYTVNGSSSLTLPSGAGCIVAFAARQWYAYVGATFIPTIPATFTPEAGVFLTGYSALTGDFAASSPPGIGTIASPVTVILAKLTGGGSNGSLTVINGLITNYVPPS